MTTWLLVAALFALLTVHPYTTYPLSLILLARCGAGRPIRFHAAAPPTSFDIVFCAYNEAGSIAAKLANCLAIAERYPNVRVHVFNDGSTDATGAVLARHADRVRVVDSPERHGKSTGMNRLLAGCRGDITVFTDANVRLDVDGFADLARYFSDPAIGCVCGHLRYVNPDESSTASVGAAYWRLEEWTKSLETATGSVMGADGSIFAVRREHFRTVPDDIIDDYFTSFSILCDGWRLVRAPAFIAFERAATRSGEEFHRKVRIACRSFNAHRLLWPRLRRLPALDLYKYGSHKLLRWFSLVWLLLGLLAVLLVAHDLGFLLQTLALAAVAVLVLLIGARRLRSRPMQALLEIIGAYVATAYGICRSMRGDRFRTWSAAKSTRSDLVHPVRWGVAPEPQPRRAPVGPAPDDLSRNAGIARTVLSAQQEGPALTIDRSRAVPTRSSPAARWPWLAPLLCFVGSCLLYLVNLERPPHPDELYHLLAARGLLEHGEPRIAEGLYTRVYLQTWLIAQAFGLLGESLSAARLPSLLAMAALNTLLFLWLRRETNARVAGLTTALFAISPFALDIAQFARFYSLQSLSFFIGCLAVYEIGRRPPTGDRQWLRYAGVAAAGIGFAVYFQPTTYFGIVGLGLWAVTVVAVPWLTGSATPQHHKILALGGVALGGVALGGVALATGLAARLWHEYRWAPLFNAPHVDEFWFYHIFYVLYYPTLWPVVGLLALAALAVWPRVAWFAVVIFATGFLLNSFAGPKNLRYIAYAQPFMFVVFGLGLAALWPPLRNAFRVFRQQLETQLAGVGLAGFHIPTILLWSGSLVALLANAALLRTATELADITVPPQLPPARWAQAYPLIEERLADVEVVVTMAELETLYYWQRYDVLFSPSRLSEMAGVEEFGIDSRTGRPVVGTLESLATIVDCTSSGLFVAPTNRWLQARFIDAQTADFVQRLKPIELPARVQLLLFSWTHEDPVATGPECRPVRERLG